MNNLLTKNDTLAIKGIAILMMLFLHLFYDSDIYLLRKFSKFTNICVPIYVFLSGYGIAKSKNKSIKSSINRIFNFYKLYLSIFIISVFLLYYFTNQLFSADEFILNLLCISYSYNHIWWYIPMYFIFLCLFPLLYKSISNNCILLTLTILLLFKFIAKIFFGGYTDLSPTTYPEMIFAILNSVSIYLIVFYVGLICATTSIKSKELVQLNKNLKENRTIQLMFLLFIIVIYMYCPNVGAVSFIFVPFVIILFKFFCSKARILELCGKYSTEMWLYHGIILLCLPKKYFMTNPIILYITFLIINLLLGYIHSNLYKKIFSFSNDK